jgi:hypothetical protein
MGGCGQEPGRWRDGARCGYCRRCYKRWLDNGFPASGPPAPRHAPGGWGTRAGRVEDYLELRSWGFSPAAAALRLGVTRRTIERYDADLCRQDAA